MARGFLISVLCIATTLLSAQDFSKKQYKIENGLPTNLIKAITQDSLGNLWIATDEGFVRYNAVAFETHSKLTHTNYTKGFYHTRNGRLLAFGDLDLFELRQAGDSTVFHSLLPVSPNPNDSSLTYPKLFYEDTRGTIWVSESQAVVRLTDTDKGIKRYPFTIADRTPQYLRSFEFFEDGNKDLFTVSVAGNVFQYDQQSDQFQKTTDKFPSQIEFASVIDSRLVIGARDGLFVAELSDDGKFKQPRLMLEIPLVSYVAPLPNGNYFVATRGSDHFIVDPAFSRKALAVSGVNDVNHVYVSTENDIWLSTIEGIVFLQESVFQGPAGRSDGYVESIAEDISTSLLYYATREELHSFDPQTKEDKTLIDHIENSYFRSVISTKNGLWASNAFKVFLIKENKIVKTYDLSEDRLFVTALNADSKENVWLTIPSRGQVLMIDNNLEIHEFEVPLGEKGFINIVKDGGDGIYVTSNGPDYLFYKSYTDSVFRNISIPVKLKVGEELSTYNFFVKDSSIWLATSLGLMKYDHKTIQAVDIGVGHNGIPIRSIYPNGEEGFLLATPKEILYYNVEKGDCNLFASSINLSAFAVNARSLLLTRDKRVWIGTSRGAFSSNHRITDKLKTLQPRLAYADADGKRITHLSREVFPYNVLLSMSITSITFPEEERVFEFRRSEDHPWKRATGTSIDIITSSPGDQYVQVRARKTGTYEWSDVTNLYFDVSRPFWMTAWFYLLIVSGIVGIIALTVVIVRARGARQKRILEGLVADRTAQLGEAYRELEGFSYSVSHDLRAPLRSVLAFSQMLDEDYGEKIDDEGRKGIATIVRNANKMNQLIDDLLKFSKALHQGLSKGPLNLNDHVNEIVEGLRESGSYPNAVVNVQPLPTVMADRGLLSQVWSNLISNGMKYSSKAEKPQVDVTFEEKEKEYVFCVKDNGAGFDMAYAERLFGVFQRLHSDKEFPGTGIGLALVKRIIARHGGRIWAEGKVNEGAKFFFTLPK